MLGYLTQLKQRIKTKNFVLTKALLLKSKRSHQGYTLLESLIAIVVISVVVAALTAPIFLSVASRVQARKAEQAMQLAQGEIDQVRRLVERGNYTTTDLNKLAPVAVSGMSDLNTVSAPTSQIIDVNNDNVHKFIVQTFRSDGIPDPNTGYPVAFKVGVRVYAWFPESQNLETQRASLTMTSAVGNQRRRPLAVLYTTVARSDSANSLSYYCNSLGGIACP